MQKSELHKCNMSNLLSFQCYREPVRVRLDMGFALQDRPHWRGKMELMMIINLSRNFQYDDEWTFGSTAGYAQT